MKIWDLYDRNENLTGEDKKRSELKSIPDICIFLLAMLEIAFECVVPRYFTINIGSGSTVAATLNAIILLALGLGFYLGNLKSPCETSSRNFSRLLLIGAVSVALVPVIEVFFFRFVTRFFFKYNLLISIFGALLLAAPSCFLFGFIVAKLIFQELDQHSINQFKNFGKIILLIAIGRIFGSLTTGFFLLPTLGTKISNLVIALILLLMSFIFGNFSKTRFYLVVMSIILLSFDGGRFLFHSWNPAVYADFDSEYARMQLVQFFVNEQGKTQQVTGIKSDSGTESFAGTHDREFIAPYNYYYDLPKYYFKNYARCLLIGGAGYTYPTYFYDQSENLNMKMDVVEIDPKMTEVANK